MDNRFSPEQRNAFEDALASFEEARCVFDRVLRDIRDMNVAPNGFKWGYDSNDEWGERLILKQMTDADGYQGGN